MISLNHGLGGKSRFLRLLVFDRCLCQLCGGVGLGVLLLLQLSLCRDGIAVDGLVLLSGLAGDIGSTGLGLLSLKAIDLLLCLGDVL